MTTRALTSRTGGSRSRRPAPPGPSIPAALYLGLALTAVATVVPFLDRAGPQVLADHIRAGYPGYDESRIDTAVNTYLVYLSIVGVLSAVGWLLIVRAVRTGKRWARGAATALFVLGTTAALTDLLVRDTSGDTGLPPLFGWLGVLPCAAGLVAVVLLWRGPRRRSAADPEPASVSTGSDKSGSRRG